MTNATTESSEKPGLADLAEIFYAPRAVFARRKDGAFLVPYVAIAVVGIALYFATKNLMQPVVESEVSRSIAASVASGKMTAEAAAKGMPLMRTVASVGLIAFWFIAPFVVALLLWIASLFTKVREMGRVAIMIATFSLCPRVIGSIVGAILSAATPDGEASSLASISISPARFVDATLHPALIPFLSRFDLFLLWSVALTAIGTEVTTNSSRGRAWATAGIVWLIASLPSIYGMIK